MTPVPLLSLLWPAGIALGLSAALTPLIGRMAVRLGVVAKPRADRWAGRPVPMLGGIAIFVAAAAGVLSAGGELHMTTAGLLLGSFLLLVVGGLDDHFAFRPQTKLVAQILGACVATGFGVGFALNPFQSFNILVSIIWIVAIINAINLMDNMDGLAAGVSLIASAFLAIQFAQSGAPSRAALAAALSGSLAGFLCFNFPPARIFMGDAGSLSIGLLLAGMSLSNTLVVGQKLGALSVLAGPALVLAIPILDVLLVTVTRVLRGQPISQGGRDHSSHRLIKMGLSERKALLVFYSLAVASGIFGLQLAEGIGHLRAVFYVALSWVPLGLFFAWLARVSVTTEDVVPTGRMSLVIGWVFKRRMMEVLMDLALAYICFCLAYGLRFDFELLPKYKEQIMVSIPWVLGLTLAAFQAMGVYAGFWENYGIRDVLRFGKAAGAATLCCIALAVVLYRYEAYPRSVFPLFGVLLFLSTLGVRTSFQFFDILLVESGPRRAVIFGVGPSALAAYAHLTAGDGRGIVAAFVDPKGERTARIYGLPVLTLEELGRLDGDLPHERLVLVDDELPAGCLDAFLAHAAKAGKSLQRYESRLSDWPAA